MKKKICILTGILMAGMLLTACMNKNNYGGTAATGNDGSTQNSTAQGGQSSDAGNSTADGGQSGESGSSAADSGQSGDAGAYGDGGNADNGQGGENGSGSGEQGSAEVNASDTYDAQNQVGAENNYESWEGTFSSDAGESITLQERDEFSLTFAFANAGISGTASREGNQAYYSGDDDHQISFLLSGNSVTVNVVNSEGSEAEGSPLIGVYIRR